MKFLYFILLSSIISLHTTQCQQVHQKIKIAFVIHELSFRGIEVSTFDYAHFNETLLGNESIIINFDTMTDNEVRKKFADRFPGKFFDCPTIEELDYILAAENVDILYYQKPGHNDGVVSKVCKNAVHVVFPQIIEPHGDVYAYISEWFTHIYPHYNLPFVPYIVRVHETTHNLRKELKIPDDALVFGRHGGAPSFNVPCAQDAIKKVAQQRPDIYFLFLNTDQFCCLPNVIFLPKTTDMEYKAQFINTCDAMIHARWRGETFGLACAEFSVKNKPIISWLNARERAHVEMLGSHAHYFATKQELINILLTFKKEPNKNWDFYSKAYSPEIVMKKFDEVFIQPLISSKKRTLVSKKLLFKAPRLSNGTINPDFLKHLQELFSLPIIQETHGQLFSPSLLNNTQMSCGIFFDNLLRKSMNTPSDSIFSLIHETVTHYTTPLLIIDGLDCMSPTIHQLLYECLRARNYRFYIIQNTLIAFTDSTVFVSPLIKAMTESWLCQFDTVARRKTIREMLAAEHCIGRLLNGDSIKMEFVNSQAFFNVPSNSLRLWKGLALLHGGNYEEAAIQFKLLIQQGFSHWRIYWYLGQALYKMGDTACEEPMMHVMQQCPQFEGIQQFKKIINA